MPSVPKQIDIGGLLCKVEVIDSSGRRRITTPHGMSVEVGPTVPDHVVRNMLGSFFEKAPPRQLQSGRPQPNTREYDNEKDDDGEEDEEDDDGEEEDEEEDDVETIPLAGVTLTNTDGSKLKIKDGRAGHFGLEAFVTAGGDTLAVCWDGATKLELDERHTGRRFVQGGEIRIDLSDDTRRPLLLKDGTDSELEEHMATGKGSDELKLILGGDVDDDEAREALAPFFD